jgi:hypothetical protein
VDPSRPPELEFKPLDVVRWESVESDAAGEPDPEVIFAKLAEAARAVTRAAGDRLVVLRARVHGHTTAHSRFQAARKVQVENCRAVLQNCLGDRVCLESVRFDTFPPAEPDAGNPDLDDAVSAVLAVINEFRQTPDVLAERMKVADDLLKLADKLPAEVMDGEDGLRPTDPTWLAGLLDRVLPILEDAGRAAEVRP